MFYYREIQITNAIAHCIVAVYVMCYCYNHKYK